jgi:NADPH-dependent 2,4-dienoyl-CoA reductase/sulfur reductase-like enzyme
MVLAPFLNPLMLGPGRAYRGIPADTVAAMIAAAGMGRTGRHIHTYADMMAPRGDRTMREGASPRQEMHARCYIVGGWPAGMVLGYLLARAGVEVVVLEKHADFLRDFRGNTIHPSTLEAFVIQA